MQDSILKILRSFQKNVGKLADKAASGSLMLLHRSNKTWQRSIQNCRNTAD